MPDIRVYLDTNILANWMLYYKDPARDKIPLQKKAKACVKLADDIANGKYSCKFITSEWALSEVVQVMIDNIIAFKILRDGERLVFFNKLRKEYELDGKDYQDIGDFYLWLLKQLEFFNIDIIKSDVVHQAIHIICVRYNIETPDALHIFTACSKSSNAAYFVTVDRELINANSKVKEIEIIEPGTLDTITSLRA